MFFNFVTSSPSNTLFWHTNCLLKTQNTRGLELMVLLLNEKKHKSFMMQKMFDEIESLIERLGLVTRFQPIYSIKRKRIMGFEALTSAQTNNLFTSYFEIYQRCRAEGTGLLFDRACRYLALKSWKEQRTNLDPSALLFINLDVSILDDGTANSRVFYEMVKYFELNPKEIIIELIEQRVNNLLVLKNFVRDYQNLGFLIAIDDFGEGNSNMERLSWINPNIIKISKQLLRGDHFSKSYHRAVLKGFVDLIHRIGAIPLIEGIEDQDQLLEAVDCDLDLMQGYLFSKPVERLSASTLEGLNNGFKELSLMANQHRLHRIKQSNQRHKSLIMTVRKLCDQLEQVPDLSVDVNSILKKIMAENPNLDGIYLISNEGIQLSKTFLRHQNLVQNEFFKPAKPGDNLSEKDYFLYHKAGLLTHVSLPYVSQATGTLCRTISMVVRKGYYQSAILCVDIQEEW